VAVLETVTLFVVLDGAADEGEGVAVGGGVEVGEDGRTGLMGRRSCEVRATNDAITVNSNTTNVKITGTTPIGCLMYRLCDSCSSSSCESCGEGRVTLREP